MKNYKVVKYLSLKGFKIVYLSMLQNLYGMSECQLSMLKQNVPAPPLEMSAGTNLIQENIWINPHSQALYICESLA